LSRYRSRIHFGELRHVPVGHFPKSALLPAARWDGSIRWVDGSTAGIAKTDALLTFNYRAGENAYRERVGLANSPRHYGGQQVYFRCPRCDGRCCKLYFRDAGLRCRRCIPAIYHVQATGAAGAALYRFRKLRNRVRSGTENERLDYFPRRPKGMRRVTYLRIKEAALRALERYHSALDVRLAGWLANLGFRLEEDR